MTKLSLLCSLTGIALIYVGAAQMRPGLTPISQIDNDYVGLKTVISGRVIDLSVHPEGHVFLKVKDESGGVISVPLFSGTRSELGERIELLDNIQVSGQVKNYQGEMELLPEDVGSIQVVHSAPIELSQIDETRLGNEVKIRGFVGEKFSVGDNSIILSVRRGDGELKVFLPGDVVESDNFPEFFEGDKIQAAGTIKSYEGELELEIGNSYNFEVLEAPK